MQKHNIIEKYNRSYREKVIKFAKYIISIYSANKYLNSKQKKYLSHLTFYLLQNYYLYIPLIMNNDYYYTLY